MKSILASAVALLVGSTALAGPNGVTAQEVANAMTSAGIQPLGQEQNVLFGRTRNGHMIGLTVDGCQGGSCAVVKIAGVVQSNSSVGLASINAFNGQSKVGAIMFKNSKGGVMLHDVYVGQGANSSNLSAEFYGFSVQLNYLKTGSTAANDSDDLTTSVSFDQMAEPMMDLKANMAAMDADLAQAAEFSTEADLYAPLHGFGDQHTAMDTADEQ